MKINKYFENSFSKIIQAFKKIYNNKTSRLFAYTFFILLFAFVFSNYFIQRDIYHSIDEKKKIIYFGQTVDLENNKVSIEYSLGFQVAFEQINRLGGINGYELRIILYNDRYEPNIATENGKLLVDYFNVLGLMGPFGTASTMNIMDKVIQGRSVPLLFPYSATNAYSEKFQKNLLLLNGTFFLEFNMILKNLKKNKIKNVSIIYQDDEYGHTNFNALNEFILYHKYDINVISSGKYKRNTTDFGDCFKSVFGMEDVYDYREYRNSENLKKMEAVIIFCVEKQISVLLGHLKRIKPELFIYYNSFVGTSSTNYEDLDKYNKDNIYQTLLNPNIKLKYKKLYDKYKEEVELHNKEVTSDQEKVELDTNGSYIGFYSGLLIGEVLKSFDNMKDLNRESFINMFYKQRFFNIHGLEVGPFVNNVSNIGLKYVSLNKLKDGKMVLIDEFENTDLKDEYKKKNGNSSNNNQKEDETEIEDKGDVNNNGNKEPKNENKEPKKQTKKTEQNNRQWEVDNNQENYIQYMY